MSIKKIKPKSPDLYLGKTIGDNTLARLAHVNYLIDEVNSIWTLSGSDIYNSNIGNVGIGGAPSGTHKFEVVGGIKSSANSILNTVSIGLGNNNIATNTCVGFEALNAITTGNGCTAIGYKALKSNLGGIFNDAFGYQALGLNTTGVTNTAFGYDALHSNVGGNYNVGLGVRALYSNTSGFANLAIGKESLYNLTGASNQNVSVGVFEQVGNQQLVTGSWNTNVGSNSLKRLVTGTGNTAIGYNALQSAASAAYNYCTALGFQALNANSTGSANIGIGYKAGAYNTTEANRIYINTIDRTTAIKDKSDSSIYIEENATVASQNIYLNGNVFASESLKVKSLPVYSLLETPATSVAINTILATTSYKYINTGGAVTFTLPDPTTVTSREWQILNFGTDNITFNYSVWLDAVTNITTLDFAYPDNTLKVFSDGTKWIGYK